jgi:hypothetical protein
MHVFKKIYPFLFIFSCFAFSEASLINSQVKGKLVYSSCIIKPPTTPAEVTYCNKIYSSYVISLQAVSAPSPVSVSIMPSPYSSSPFDICKYEPAHFVFNSILTQPFCPA